MRGNGEQYEQIKECSKGASSPVLRPTKEKPQPIGREEDTMKCVSAHHVKSVMSVSPKAVRGDLPSRLRVEALQREDAKPLRRRQGTPLAAFFNTPLLEKGKLITSAARVEDRENTEDRFPPMPVSGFDEKGTDLQGAIHGHRFHGFPKENAKTRRSPFPI
jgi:hypothetical protein